MNEKPKFLPGKILCDQALYYFLEYPQPNKILFHILHVKKTEDSFEHAYEVMEHHAMKQSDIATYLCAAGFRNVRFYGDYAFSPYSQETSAHLIAVAQR